MSQSITSPDLATKYDLYQTYMNEWIAIGSDGKVQDSASDLFNDEGTPVNRIMKDLKRDVKLIQIIPQEDDLYYLTVLHRQVESMKNCAKTLSECSKTNKKEAQEIAKKLGVLDQDLKAKILKTQILEPSTVTMPEVEIISVVESPKQAVIEIPTATQVEITAAKVAPKAKVIGYIRPLHPKIVTKIEPVKEKKVCSIWKRVLPGILIATLAVASAYALYSMYKPAQALPPTLPSPPTPPLTPPITPPSPLTPPKTSPSPTPSNPGGGSIITSTQENVAKVIVGSITGITSLAASYVLANLENYHKISQIFTQNPQFRWNQY